MYIPVMIYACIHVHMYVCMCYAVVYTDNKRLGSKIGIVFKNKYKYSEIWNTKYKYLCISNTNTKKHPHLLSYDIRTYCIVGFYSEVFILVKGLFH